ncbi:hypothetical protein [Caulobacter sp. SSI4214]|uniref:hypothetical protein n=1 Tax=Caulobacter sp. SSI4214 TaxID=2575739 RepID=UPI00143BE023|nr:hypothetical protein [Caulobacter sp. SSI4214]
MPSIKLNVLSAKLTSTFGVGYGVAGDGKWALVFSVKPAFPDQLELGTGEEIGKLGPSGEFDMRLTFRNTEPELVEWATERTKGVKDTFRSDEDIVCGTMSYHAEWSSKDGLESTPASIVFDLYTPSEVMASLVRFAESGRFVKQISIEVRGLEYGWAPDGSVKKWADNTDQKMLPVVNVSYELPLLEIPEPDYDDDETKARRAPQTSVGADLAPLLRESMKLQRWALYALAIIAGAVALKGWR